MKYENEVKNLEAQRAELSNQIHFAKTLELQERRLALETEIKTATEDLRVLQLQSRQTDERVKPEIERLRAEIKRLAEESFDAQYAAQIVESDIRAKRSKVWSLEKQIREFK